MLTTNDIQQKIAVWEDQTTEFKREVSTDEIRKSLVAFSNDYHQQGGGIIVVGVDKTKNIVGIENVDDTMLRLSGLCRDITPSIAPNIYAVEIENKKVVVVEVKQSNRRPHRTNNICYIRIGTSNRPATFDEESELTRRSGQMPYDLIPIRNAQVDADLDMSFFMEQFLPKRVSSEVLLQNGRTPAQWLEHLKLAYREGNEIHPTVAAVLLFGKRPQQFIPHAYIDFIRFEGNDKSVPIKDRKEITGSLLRQIETAIAIIQQYSPETYQFSDKSPIRTNKVEYPMRAIREALANALTHRDYEFTHSAVSVNMFDDRIEIFSPGGLFGIVTPQNFGTGVNDYRNPNIATGLSILGVVEKAGTGISQIKTQMQENGSVVPDFEIGDKYLTAKLPAHPFYQGIRLYEKALKVLASKDKPPQMAIDYLTQTLHIEPNFAEAWVTLGQAYNRLHDIENVRYAYSQAIKYSPTFERAYNEWADIEKLAGNLTKSVEIHRSAAKFFPHNYIVQISSLPILKFSELEEFINNIFAKNNIKDTKINVWRDKKNTPNLYYADITTPSESTAQRIVQLLDGYKIMGKTINARLV